MAEEGPQVKRNSTVRYVGEATVRKISQQQWQQAGVSDQDDTVWDEANAYEMPATMFSHKALKVIKSDGKFEIT